MRKEKEIKEELESLLLLSPLLSPSKAKEARERLLEELEFARAASWWVRSCVESYESFCDPEGESSHLVRERLYSEIELGRIDPREETRPNRVRLETCGFRVDIVAEYIGAFGKTTRVILSQIYC